MDKQVIEVGREIRIALWALTFYLVMNGLWLAFVIATYEPYP